MQMAAQPKNILGSPLRVQGKVTVRDNDNNVIRITPACAGKRANRHIKKPFE